MRHRQAVLWLEYYREGRWRGREGCTSVATARRVAQALRRRGFVVATVQGDGQVAWWDERETAWQDAREEDNGG